MKKRLIVLSIIFFATLQVSISAQENASESRNMAKQIIDKYVDAIGGKDALSSVKDRTTIMRGNIMGQNVTLMMKQKWPNKLRQEIRAGEMNQITVFNGEKAAMSAAGQVLEISGKELEALKIESSMELLTDPEAYGITLSYEGESLLDEIPVYQVKMTLPSGLRWFQFFDKETGLKLQENKEMQTQMGLIETTTYYSDYKEVDGKLYPYKIKQSMGPQSFEMTVSSIRVNTGMDDSIFELEDTSEPLE